MSRSWLLVASLAALVGTAGCRQEASAAAARALQEELAARAGRLASRRADTSAAASLAPLARWELPASLSEISDLALLSDGRLLTHDDEHARITVIDPRGGAVLKVFDVGSRGATSDFEGITVAGDVIYLMTSRGVLHVFREGADGAPVKEVVHDTRLGKACEFEGVVHDPAASQLVMACKDVGDKDLEAFIVLYRVPLPLSATSVPSRVAIPLDQLRATHPWKSLHPTDITRHPGTGNYVMVAAPERALIEITPDGRVVRAVPLPGTHEQAEGVAITTDGVLIVSDEAVASAATITLYRWPPDTTSRGQP